MQLTPRYGTDPIIRLDGPPAAIAGPTVRQRRRLLDVVSAFDAQQWNHPTRCDGWSARDVIVHLDSTNTFWSYSIASGLNGAPTQFLASFDPVADPAKLVVDAGDLSSADLLERFTVSTNSLCDQLSALDPEDWSTLAESPPGHVSITALAHHALWDSWVHERDILIPTGVDPEHHDDEVAACLRYAIALSPAFALSVALGARGTFGVTATDPTVAATVDVGSSVSVRAAADPAGEPADFVLSGDAVTLADALSMRGALHQQIPAGSAWMFDGLAQIFDSVR